MLWYYSGFRLVLRGTRYENRWFDFIRGIEGWSDTRRDDVRRKRMKRNVVRRRDRPCETMKKYAIRQETFWSEGRKAETMGDKERRRKTTCDEETIWNEKRRRETKEDDVRWRDDLERRDDEKRFEPLMEWTDVRRKKTTRVDDFRRIEPMFDEVRRRETMWPWNSLILDEIFSIISKVL